MIKDFANNTTIALFKGLYVRGIDKHLQEKAHQKLLLIHAASNITDLRIPPSNRLKKLSGTRGHLHSIRINNQWRIVFCWKDNDAYEVEFLDYH